MPCFEEAAEQTAVNLARECLYRFLAAALHDPGTAGWQPVQDIGNQDLARQAADLLRAEGTARPVPRGFGELAPSALDLKLLLVELLEPVRRLRTEYDRVFGLVPARECPPYETEYHPAAETFFRSQQLADIAGFYRAFGIEPADAVRERPDHLALELEFMAFVLLKKRLALAANGPEGSERAAVCDEAERSFFREHLAWWVPAFATGLRRKAGTGFYAEVGRALAAWVPVERGLLGLPAAPLPVQAALIERPEEQAACAGCS
jgi:TorA maturation chaperone TorD